MPHVINSTNAVSHRIRRPNSSLKTCRALPVVDLSDVGVQFPVKHLTADGHLQLVERVLHDVVRVQLVDPPRGHIHVRLGVVGVQEELGARHGVEALQAEVLCLHDLEPGRRLWPGGDPVCRRSGWGLLDGVEAGCDGVDTIYACTLSVSVSRCGQES